MSKRDGVIKEFIYFMKHHKAFWMIPILVSLFVAGLLVVLSGSSVAPFIYTLF